ncbi:DHH family phosphoesterase [Sulfuracidifex metallicus]|uniref:DHH family phosphoesterase n=1 Tax=Sulfuracidifex metallicus DSM 6482 = JCM 9184 TaxID=523847 RepID=A0A6A9QWX4_SULME|nr:DHHA1 domain-containing protein [Sulfuracidifex metallicus]MUN29542.1 DHH family phosphoesterase [Sulfuracidifex metallicus DSM 6482 = JCM 9184]WOE49947.1 DHHA1 domain-containing protein [Sulfuracidifex metallicus DSM 6482 = JCM 9184]
MEDYYAIVHNDFDGTASAAVYARAVGYLPKNTFFTEPTRLHNFLNKLELRGVKKIVLADLGANGSTIDQVTERLSWIVSQGVEVEWFDHHVWKQEWKDKVTQAGVHLYHDTSTCGAGVVHKVKNPQDEFSSKLASADCSVDIWLHNDPMGEKLRRVVENSPDYSWKLHLVETFFKGELWNDEFQKILEDKIDEELKGYKKLEKYFKVIDIDGKKVAIAIRWRGPPDISYASQYIMSRTGAVVFVSANGKSISFRSSTYEIRRFALEFGGGGHPLAAGAALRVPALHRFFRRIGIRKFMMNWVTTRVEQAVKKAGFQEYKENRAMSQ